MRRALIAAALGIILAAVLQSAWDRRADSWWAYALRLTRNPADADDVVQDAVACTLQAGPDLPDECAANRYVLSAVRTAAFKLFRSRKVTKPAARLDDSFGSSTSLGSNGDDRFDALQMILAREVELEQDELWSRLKTRIRSLTPEQRQVLDLLVLREEPLKLREVAEIQDAPISTVHSRLGAALKQLASIAP